MFCGKEGGTAGEDKSTEGSPQKKIKLGADPFSHLLHQNVGRNWGRSKQKRASGGPLTFKISALCRNKVWKICVIHIVITLSNVKSTNPLTIYDVQAPLHV